MLKEAKKCGLFEFIPTAKLSIYFFQNRISWLDDYSVHDRQTPSCLRNLVESLPDPQVEIPKVLVWIMCCWLHIACVRALMKIKHWEINRKRKFINPIVCWLNKISIKAHSFLINDGQALMLHNAQGIK